MVRRAAGLSGRFAGVARCPWTALQLRMPLREPLRPMRTAAAATTWLRWPSALREGLRRPVRGRQLDGGCASPATATRLWFVGAGRASCRSADANRASDRSHAAGPAIVRRALRRQRDRPGALRRPWATRSAATRRAPPLPARPCTWRRQRRHRPSVGGASRRDRTPTGHALVRPAAGTHPHDMACDPASITAPRAVEHSLALAVIAIRLPPAQPIQAVSQHRVVRAARPSEANKLPPRLSCHPPIAAPSATPAATPCRASGAKHRRLGNLGSSKALS